MGRNWSGRIKDGVSVDEQMEREEKTHLRMLHKYASVLLIKKAIKSTKESLGNDSTWPTDASFAESFANATTTMTDHVRVALMDKREPHKFEEIGDCLRQQKLDFSVYLKNTFPDKQPVQDFFTAAYEAVAERIHTNLENFQEQQARKFKGPPPSLTAGQRETLRKIYTDFSTSIQDTLTAEIDALSGRDRQYYNKIVSSVSVPKLFEQALETVFSIAAKSGKVEKQKFVELCESDLKTSFNRSKKALVALLHFEDAEPATVEFLGNIYESVCKRLEAEIIPDGAEPKQSHAGKRAR